MDSPTSIESLAREVQVLRDKLALAEGREREAADEAARHLRTIDTLVGPDSSHERMRQVLLWLDRRGGLGYHVHESIQSALRGSEVSRG